MQHWHIFIYFSLIWIIEVVFVITKVWNNKKLTSVIIINYYCCCCASTNQKRIDFFKSHRVEELLSAHVFMNILWFRGIWSVWFGLWITRTARVSLCILEADVLSCWRLGWSLAWLQTVCRPDHRPVDAVSSQSRAKSSLASDWLLAGVWLQQ